jgi:hypothetical protein
VNVIGLHLFIFRRKTMKKLVIALSACVLAFGIVACNKGSNAPDTTTTTTTTTTTGQPPSTDQNQPATSPSTDQATTDQTTTTAPATGQ